MNDLLGGQVDFMCDQTTNTTPQIKGGKVKAYAVTTKKRVPSLPDVPTLDEQGLKGFEVGIWHGLWAPQGTPKPAIDKLVAALQAALKDPDGRREVRRARHRARARRTARTPAALRRAPQGRDRQVGADHQEGRRLRRLTVGCEQKNSPSRFGRGANRSRRRNAGASRRFRYCSKRANSRARMLNQ